MHAASPHGLSLSEWPIDGSNDTAATTHSNDDIVAPLLALPAELLDEIASTLTLVGIVGFALSNRRMLARFKAGRRPGFAALQAIRQITDGDRSGDLVVAALNGIAAERNDLQPALLRHLGTRINGLNMYTQRQYLATSKWSTMVEAHWYKAFSAGQGHSAIARKRDVLVAMWCGICAPAYGIEQFMALANAKESLMKQIATLPEPHAAAALNAIWISDNTCVRPRRLAQHRAGDQGDGTAADEPWLRFTDQPRPFLWTLDGTVTCRTISERQSLVQGPLFVIAFICIAFYLLELLYTHLVTSVGDNRG